MACYGTNPNIATYGVTLYMYSSGDLKGQAVINYLILSGDGLMLKMSAFESLYGG